MRGIANNNNSCIFFLFCMHSKTILILSCCILLVPKASSIALYIAEFRDVDVIPIGYNLTVVCTGNESRERDFYEGGQPFRVQLFFRNESVKRCGGGSADKEVSKSCELRIEKVSRHNSGHYDCMVSNFQRCSTAELTLSVRGEHLHPSDFPNTYGTFEPVHSCNL